jgi:predicted ATPase/DNA-binding SARP family transcriptional activator
MPPRVDVRILGPFELAVDGKPVAIGSAKQRLLLARLAAQLNRPLTAEGLITTLWGETPPASVDTTLRSLVSRLRRLLAELPPGSLTLAGGDAGYTLQAEIDCLDASRFEADVAAAHRLLTSGEPAEAARCFAAGLERWRGGSALPELADDEETRLEIARLEEARLAAIEALADAELAAGRPERAQAALETLVAAHPLREAAWGRLMLALYRQSRQADALRVFQRARELLVEELGLEPGPDLRRLEQQILNHSPELDGPGGSSHETVAFLFTDIEASTRRWEGDRQAMGVDLSRHDEALRTQVEQAAGRVFAHTGDGLCASFATAAAAIAAAVAGQHALRAQQWEGPEPLRVRMAVHAGTAEARGDNWVGPPLNRAARLLALAGGGQILCSRAAADLAGDNLPPDVRLRDLGEHRLADLSRPEQVFQVDHPDLPAVFPALRSGDAPRSNLPGAMTTFLGRGQELDELAVLLNAGRILTLTGVGGAGKTRLAIELARNHLDEFPDGAWLVELAPIRDATVVAEAVAGTLGLQSAMAGGQGAIAQLTDWLAARRLLLVLDNCEHVVDAVAALLEAVLPGAPGVSVLATSREILALPGEVTWAVPPLSLPPVRPVGAGDLKGSDAVELFCERARSAQPAFALSDANATAIAQICHRLDGVPLAIELAASRIRVLGAQQLAERLDDRFRLLGGTSRRGATRHQTLQATMDWSWELLPPAEQRALRRISVFPASFNLDAAEAVVYGLDDEGDDIPAFDLVARLADKSLVAVAGDEPEMRYHLLETVRTYAAARLAEAGEEEAVGQAHRDHFLTHADRSEALGYWGSGGVFVRVTTDEANFRRAILWSLDRGHRAEAVRLMAAYWLYAWWASRTDVGPLLARCLADPLPAPSRALVECICGAFLGDADAGQLPDVEQRLRRALQVADEIGDADGAARTRFYLGNSIINQGRLEEARSIVTVARDHFADAGLAVPRGWCEHELGWVCLLERDYAGAKECFERALSYVDVDPRAGGKDATDVFLAAQMWGGLALTTAALGAADEARHWAEETVVVTKNLPLPGFTVMGLLRASEVAALIEDDAMAAEALAQLLALLRELGSRRWVADALEASVAVLPATTQDDAAMSARLLGKAGELREALGEVASAFGPVTDRVARRRAEILDQLGEAAFGAEIARGKRATADEALRWALAALQTNMVV